MEVWKDIEGYEGLYEVSNFGSVKSLSKKVVREKNGFWIQPEKILKPSITKSGYCHVRLYKDFNFKVFLLHRIVAKTFIANPYNKSSVNHKNGVKNDNCFENLEWVTNSENTLHAFRNGLLKPLKGDLNGSSKLTKSQVLEIRNKLDNKVFVYKIMEEYRISRAQVQRIRNRECWNHV
jgi:hypothetical protein